MIASAVAVVALFALAAAPGLLLCRDRPLPPAGLAAVAAGSLTLCMMATALLAIACSALFAANLPAWALAPVSLLLAAAAWFFRRGASWILPRPEWQGLAVAALFVLQGALVYALSVTDQSDGALRIHAFYNADWFKHIAHTFGIADYGLPARDIFGGGRPLHYYWLSHILPGAGTAIGGDAWAALYTANVIYVGLLALCLYGVIRLSGASANVSLVVAALATTICATPGTWSAVFSGGVRDNLPFGGDFPPEPAFASLALYIPQHAFALCLLLAWAVLALGKPAGRAPRAIALAALASVMTISILFGAVLLAAYGLTELYRKRVRAVPEVAAMAVASVLFVLILGVFQIADPTASFARANAQGTNPGSTADLLHRVTAAFMSPINYAGIPFLVALYLALKWKPKDDAARNAYIFAIAATGAAIASAVLSELAIGDMVAGEVRLRVMNLLAVSTGIVGGWAVNEAWSQGRAKRTLAVAALALLALAAAPTIWFRIAWHANAHDRFTTIIPADDRAVLTALRNASDPRDIVWQYPEDTVLSDAGGDDSWSAVIAGRTNISSPRATEFSAAQPEIELARRYFAGEDVPVPPEAGWVYLSRKLHPASYDALERRLEGDRIWTKAACRPDACTFRRRPR